MNPVLKKNFAVFPVLDCNPHHAYPQQREQLIRYYGYYSNVSRGKRKKEKPEDTTEISEIDAPPMIACNTLQLQGWWERCITGAAESVFYQRPGWLVFLTEPYRSARRMPQLPIPRVRVRLKSARAFLVGAVRWHQQVNRAQPACIPIP
jgi:hypothetical protein